MYIKYIEGGSMIEKLQIYISSCYDPYINLATEKHLLDTTDENCIRLFLWQNENTVVIGRNQNIWAECNCSLAESENINIARRLSGGGAVFHDLGNLNFTFLCSFDNYDIKKHLEVIKSACNYAGIQTEISGRNDILANGRKFSGNAFYNSKNKSYHHGTLLINADTEKMCRYLTPSEIKLKSKGVKSVKSRVINLSELSPALTCKAMIEHMIKAFENVYGIKAERLNEIDVELIKETTEKYSSWEYIYGSSAPFTFSCEKNFTWGNVQLNLNVSKGVIEDVKLYTDSMDWTISENIEKSLLGCRFETKSMCEAISNKLAENIADEFVKMIKNN